MKRNCRLFIFFLLFLIGLNETFAQKIFLRPDVPVADSFPVVKGKIWYRGFGQTALTKEQLTLSENGTKVEYSFKPVELSGTAPKNKRVIILVENHWLSIGVAERKFFGDVISRGISSAINPGDQIMVCSFDWYRDGKYVFQETSGYTDDVDVIAASVKAITAKSFRDQQQVGADINQSLMEAMTIISQEKDSMPSAIFLFSDELDNTAAKILPVDIKSESLKRNIPIYSISYFNFSRYSQIIRDQICFPTYGSYFASKKNDVDSCATFLNKFLNSVISDSRGSQYEYSYNSKLPKNGQSAELKFEVSSIPATAQGPFQIPKQNFMEWVLGNKIISGAVLFAIILILVLVIVFVKKSKKNRLKQQEELLRTQDALRMQTERSENEKKQTDENLRKLKQEQTDREMEADRLKNLEKQKIEEERLTKLMLMKGAFPRLNYSFQGNSGSVDVSKPVFSIGREKTNDFYIQLNTVSKKHATIYFNENGLYSIVDHKSSNGTRVNGNVVSESPLRSGDFIEVGEIGITFQS